LDTRPALRGFPKKNRKLNSEEEKRGKKERNKFANSNSRKKSLNGGEAGIRTPVTLLR
jgi:hypothetical protein